MKKNITIIILIIVTISIIINLYSISFSDNKNKIEKVSTKETFTDKENMLSIMVIDENGSYEETQDRTSWPDSSTYEYYGSECTDSEGTIIPSEEAITFENNTIHIKTKNTIYCTLYFYNLKISPLLKNLYKTTGPAYLKIVPEDDELLRYVGEYTDANEGRLNNYICFGTNDESTCLGNKDTYMYRIIGITTENVNRELELVPNQLKLIKATPYADIWTNHGAYDWDYANNGAKNYVNNTYLKSITDIEENVGIHTWEELISNPKWYKGDTGGDKDNPPKTNPKVLTNNYKIGLMYINDYVNSQRIYTPVISPNSWLYRAHAWRDYEDIFETLKNKGDLTMSDINCTDTMCGVYFIHPNGIIWSDWSMVWCNLRPVFYLIPDITLTGEGTEENPFLISTP